MRFKIFFAFLFVLTCGMVIQSCRSTKFVPDGEYLLVENEVKVDVKDVNPVEMNTHIKQKPNFRTFSFFKLPLSIYNLSGEDSTKWINKTLRHAGEPPVLYDSTMIWKSINDLTRIMHNKGYLHAEVDTIIKLKEKKAFVTYDIKAGKPFRVKEYNIQVNDSVIDERFLPEGATPPRLVKNMKLLHSQLRADSILAKRPLIKQGDLFDMDVLDLERDRIASMFRRTGYYAFNKEYIGFVADTVASEGNRVDVNLDLAIYPFMQRAQQTGIETVGKHRRYTIKEVLLYVDFNPLIDGDISGYKTSSVYSSDGYTIVYGPKGRYIKPNVVLANCYITPGTLYDENMTTLTYNALTQLNILKNVNINFVEVMENDSAKLRCTITCVPDKRQGLSTEVEGTNSGGFFGVESAVGYTHRNAFRGSEVFNAKLKGAYEAITPKFTDFSQNYFEVGGETSLTFPRFMFPFLDKDFRRDVMATTRFSTNYTYQRRPEYFTRTILSAGLKYTWQERKQSAPRHTFDLLDISYVHIPKLEVRFDTTLTENAKRYSFTDQFILGMGYTYTKTNFSSENRKSFQPIYSFRFSVESAGNLLDLAARLTNAERDSLGTRSMFGTRYAQYLRGTIDYSRTIRIDEKNSVAWHIGGGLAYPYGNFKEIPIQKRFFSGGANSVRGWGIRELGPGSFFPKTKKFDNFYYHSGDMRLDASIEYRSKLFWVLELGAFVDAGNVWTAKKYEGQELGNFELDRFYKEIALAWGLGLRFDFDFFLLRLDCGWKAYDPSEKPGATKWPIKDPFNIGHNTAWHIAVGYPF